jgi:hypothetical protein
MPKPLPPEALFIDWVGSPIGAMLIVHNPEGRVRVLDFHDYEPRTRHLLRLHYGRDRIDLAVKNRPVPTTIRAMLAAYFAGDFAVIDAVPVMTAGTSFQRQVSPVMAAASTERSGCLPMKALRSRTRLQGVFPRLPESANRFGDEIAGWADAVTEISYPSRLPPVGNEGF